MSKRNADVTIYGSPHCPHCVNAKEYFGDKATFVNCDEDRQACVRTGVKAMPTIVTSDGERAVGWSGAHTVESLKLDPREFKRATPRSTFR